MGENGKFGILIEFATACADASSVVPNDRALWKALQKKPTVALGSDSRVENDDDSRIGSRTN